jgi:hypothetical protein
MLPDLVGYFAESTQERQEQFGQIVKEAKGEYRLLPHGNKQPLLTINF